MVIVDANDMEVLDTGCKPHPKLRHDLPPQDPPRCQTFLVTEKSGTLPTGQYAATETV